MLSGLLIAEHPFFMAPDFPLSKNVGSINQTSTGDEDAASYLVEPVPMSEHCQLDLVDNVNDLSNFLQSCDDYIEASGRHSPALSDQTSKQTQQEHEQAYLLRQLPGSASSMTTLLPRKQPDTNEGKSSSFRWQQSYEHHHEAPSKMPAAARPFIWGEQSYAQPPTSSDKTEQFVLSPTLKRTTTEEDQDIPPQPLVPVSGGAVLSARGQPSDSAAWSSSEGIHTEQVAFTIHPYQHERWTERYEDLVEFQRRNGHCSVPYVYPQNPCLGQWVKRQRHQYKLMNQGSHSNLTQDRIQVLESIGFTWDSHGSAWEENYAALKAFQRTHGNCCVPCSYKGSSKLSTWIKRQRRQYRLFVAGKSSTIDATRINRLEELGLVWDYYGDRIIVPHQVHVSSRSSTCSGGDTTASGPRASSS